MEEPVAAEKGGTLTVPFGVDDVVAAPADELVTVEFETPMGDKVLEGAEADPEADDGIVVSLEETVVAAALALVAAADDDPPLPVAAKHAL